MNYLISCIYHHSLDSESLSRTQVKAHPITLDIHYSDRDLIIVTKSGDTCLVVICSRRCSLASNFVQDDPITLHISSTQAFHHSDHYDVYCTTVIAFYIFYFRCKLHEGRNNVAQQCLWNIPKGSPITIKHQNTNVRVHK